MPFYLTFVEGEATPTVYALSVDLGSGEEILLFACYISDGLKQNNRVWLQT